MQHRDQDEPGTGTLHDERLWPSPGVWFLVLLMAAGAFVVVLPVGVAAGAVVAVLAAAGLSVAAVRSAAVVSVQDGELRAGRARVPVALLGAAEPARGVEARSERGPRLDPRAYLLIRAWVDPVVRVRVEDPQDPTPYWLVSTRRPEELVDALERARSRQ